MGVVESQLLREDVKAENLELVPVNDHPLLNRVLQVEDLAATESFFAYVDFFLAAKL